MADSFYVKTAAEARDDGLRTLKNGLVRAGVTSPNVRPGSDYFILFEAIGNEIEVLGANLIIRCDELMPDTATGEGLLRWLRAVRLDMRPAAGSAGAIVLDASAPSPVSLGAELLDTSGLRYGVTVAGVYASGDTIPIEALDAGDATNLAAGSVLAWVSAPPYSAQKAAVAVGGLTGGAEAEDEETARRRLLRRLASFPGSGNATHVVEVAEAATPAVQAAFVYPAAMGPATQRIAVVGYASAVSKSRVVSAAKMSGLVVPHVAGSLAEHSDVRTTTVTDWPTDVAISLALPASPSSSTPGAGGGWLDATPYPRPIAPMIGCDVQAVTSSTQFEVRSAQAPTKNVSRIAWLSPLDWKLYTATVVDVSGVGPAWTITIDQPFVNIGPGHLISPQAVRLQAYFDALLGAFALMGPGELTAAAGVLARAFRHPTPAQMWPASLGATQLRAVTDAGPEVLDAQYLYRSTTTPPPVPAAVTDPPRILTPRHLAFYELL